MTMTREEVRESLADWTELVTKYVDLFRSDHCGYWLRGMNHDNRRGWLAWEMQDDEDLTDPPLYHEAWVAWVDGKPLPVGYYRLDAAFARRAWRVGVRQRGESWYDEGDAEDYDVVVQLALLGEVRYG